MDRLKMFRTTPANTEFGEFFSYRPTPAAVPPVAPKPYAKQHRVQPPVQTTKVKTPMTDEQQDAFWAAEALRELDDLLPKRF